MRVAARTAQRAVAVLNDVASAQECEELIALAKPRLTPSTTVDPLTGQDRVGKQRSSLGMFVRLRENAFIARLNERVSQPMNLPVENGEGLQVLHYPIGAQSLPHFDFLVPSNAAKRDSLERSGKLLGYLNDVEEGGATVFLEIGWSVSPQRGSLGQVDHASLHAGAAVLRGEKWVATKWMRQRRFVAAGEASSHRRTGDSAAILPANPRLSQSNGYLPRRQSASMAQTTICTPDAGSMPPIF